MSEDSEKRTVDALLQEHQELVQLFVHENSLSWQLNLAFLAMNGVVISAAVGYGLFDKRESLVLPIYLFLLFGAILNPLTYFVFQRSKLHREARLVRAYEVEDQLAQKGIDLQTLRSCEQMISRGKVIREADKPRNLRWDERVEVLGFRWSPLLVAGLFIIGMVWLAFGRPVI